MTVVGLFSGAGGFAERAAGALRGSSSGEGEYPELYEQDSSDESSLAFAGAHWERDSFRRGDVDRRRFRDGLEPVFSASSLLRDFSARFSPSATAAVALAGRFRGRLFVEPLSPLSPEEITSILPPICFRSF